MSKRYDPKDPDGVGEWTRKHFNIVNESTSDYLVRNGFTFRTAEGRIKLLYASLAWIETQQTALSRPIVDEIRKIADDYKHAFETRELTEIDSLLYEKSNFLWQQAMAIHKVKPIIDAQREYKKKQSERASKPRKLTESENMRIAKNYWESKESGEGYGVVKALSAAYNVSETTIHNIVRKHKPQ